MHLIYILLSPTFGMHQYTADLANRMAKNGWRVAGGEGPGASIDGSCNVHLVTTTTLPRERYSPAVQVHTPITTHGTGFAPEGLNPADLRTVLKTLAELTHQPKPWSKGNGHSPLATRHPPPVAHITGVHLWNPLLVRWLRQQGVPVIHTLHDLDPHAGVRFASLIRLWNRLILSSADIILVHGQQYRQRLLNQGLPDWRVTATPLLCLFLDHTHTASLAAQTVQDIRYEPWALFFGRLEAYKGIRTLLQAAERMGELANKRISESTNQRNDHSTPQPFADSPFAHPAIHIAGSGNLASFWSQALPDNVTLDNRLVDDWEAVDLFRRCGVVVLPYVDATQSALVASAYYFRKPVIVAASGALPEYVLDGQTGWVVPPGDSKALADCLSAALIDPSRLRAMGEAGRAWYEQQRELENKTVRSIYRRATRNGHVEEVFGQE